MHNFPAFYSPYGQEFLLTFMPLIMVAVIWTIFIKGYALWHAARNSQKWWFIALLVVNSLGILEIVYLIWFRPKSDSHISATSVASSPT